MPEIRFCVQWPDGREDLCYSPSWVIQEYFVVGESYELEDFLQRARTALTIASDRVQAKYGRPCSLALGQLQQIEVIAQKYPSANHPHVRLLDFIP